MTKILLTISISCLPLFLFAQSKSFDDLYGFRLGRYATVLYNELGEPNQIQTDEDSTQSLIYYITPDKKTYLIAEISNWNPKQITSLQVSGEYSSRPFYGLQLQSTYKAAEKFIGKPDTILTQKFNEKESVVWKYKQSRISLLFQSDSLRSIRIWEGADDTITIPNLTFEEILLAFGTQDRKKILDIMSPNMEVYVCGQVLSWSRSIYYDSTIDTASVYHFLTNEEYGISSLATREFTPPELSMRITQNYGLLHVYKFADDPVIEEIVLIKNKTRYQIWEIKYICPEGETNE